MEINQGDILLCNLDPVKGHEQGGYRPVLVIQNDILNRDLSTIIIAPLTTNLKGIGRVTTVFISKNSSRLKKDSLVLLFQLRVLDKSRIKEKVCNIGKDNFFEVRKQLGYLF
ncbi:MAG: type II toxin-antitoxin system PemK/MazF family toxin [Candidatus Paceibacterota bacterium]|jgi:mRNA interferase MazF